MTNATNVEPTTPDVVKITENKNNGIRSVTLSRMAIGYVVRGRKFVYCDDRCTTIDEGEVFIYEAGHHYEENTIGASGSYEQIMFYASPSALQRIILGLNSSYGVTYTSRHSCDICRTGNFVAMAASTTVSDFFTGVNRSLHKTGFQHNDVGQRIKLNELIYLILSGEECCLRSKLLHGADTSGEQFAQVIQANLFNDISIEELARLTNRSLTSFKKEFRRRFDTPPHKWFIAQRLNRAKILLLSTSKTISEVGAECAFSNISHFIKLFKSRFHATPAAFRQHYRSLPDEEPLRSASGE
ncbi:MAG: helix-turn-helix transcriptional regulator [Alistipes sp.]|nr:helix-turn-helix transcriptional regulator [Alistipes sp.]